MISDYLTPGRSSITRLSESDKSQRYKEERGQEREVLTKASLPETIPERGNSRQDTYFCCQERCHFVWQDDTKILKRLIQLTTEKLNCWGQGDSIERHPHSWGGEWGDIFYIDPFFQYLKIVIQRPHLCTVGTTPANTVATRRASWFLTTRRHRSVAKMTKPAVPGLATIPIPFSSWIFRGR